MMAGVIMLIVALLALMYWGWNIRHCEQQASMYVETLRTLIPEPQDALPEERRDNTMSTLSIDGVNFVGLLELPRYGSVLPAHRLHLTVATVRSHLRDMLTLQRRVQVQTKYRIW